MEKYRKRSLDIFTKAGVAFEENNPRHVEIRIRFGILDHDMYTLIYNLTDASLTYAWKYPQRAMDLFEKCNPNAHKWLTEYWKLIEEENDLKAELKGGIENEGGNTQGD